MRYVFDIEVYPNYMLVGFMREDRKIVRQFASTTKLSDDQIFRIKRLLDKELVGFNSKGYDDVMLTYMLSGGTVDRVYKNSKKIIEESLNYWNVFKDLGVDKKYKDSIDLIDVAPGQASLKLYGARLNSKKLQDLPYDPHKHLTAPEMEEVRKYNVNDLHLTVDLYLKLIPQLELRAKIGEQYGMEVMSKSDAQIAESIFKIELQKKGIKVSKSDSIKSICYQAPKVIKFEREDLNKLVKRIEATTIQISDVGQPITPDWLKDYTVDIGECTFAVGLGGLHSQEKSMVIRPKEDEILANVDVASYYPSLIIDLGLYPKQLTRKFLDIYAGVKKQRLEAKRSGDKVTDSVLKITLNGSYGKFGSKYSFLYSPDLLLTVTFTGQLYLLMLIEKLTNNGLKVVSSNTDGVEILLKKKQTNLLKSIVKEWESITNMEMEFGEYNGLYARDVNNYVAVYPEGKTKAKGAYAEPTLMKNIEYPVVFEAIREYLGKGVPMEDTIYNCKDIARFTSSRTVKGGAVYNYEDLGNSEEYNNHLSKFGELKVKAIGKRNDDYLKEQVLKSSSTKYLGKVVRFYYSTDGKPIFYQSGNKVPKSDGVKPLMELTDYIPKDLDYDKYLELCNEHLRDLGITI